MSEVDRDKKGRFLAGNSGNGGRKRGSRSKLSQAFLDVLNADFDAHGADVVVKVRTEQPAVYFKTIAALLPAKMETSLQITSIFAELNLTDPGEFAMAWEVARKVIYGRAPVAVEQDDLSHLRREVEFTDED